MSTVTKLLLMLSFLIIGITGFGLTQKREKPPVYQASEYACSGNLMWSIARICVENKIDYKEWERFLRIECPTCGVDGAYIDMTKDITELRCFTTAPIPLGTIKAGESKEVSFEGVQWYCAKCYYPLGTDWKIINKNCTFEEIDPNSVIKWFDDYDKGFVDGVRSIAEGTSYYRERE